jgi:hypothetical protein
MNMMDYKKILQSELKCTDVCDVDAYDGQANGHVGGAPPDDYEILLKNISNEEKIMRALWELAGDKSKHAKKPLPIRAYLQN